MKTLLNISLLTLFTTLFYWYVGQMVPQKETYPPEDVAIGADMTPDELARVGEEIVAGKGACFSCHTIGSHGSRAPDLAGIGARAGNQKEGLSDVEYMAESLFEPNAFVAEGYNPIMTPADKPPISLTQEEILAVIAYLQSLGGVATVTTSTSLPYTSAVTAVGPASAVAEAGGPSALDELPGEELFSAHGCLACHNISEPIKMVGPSLYDIGTRMTRGEIYTSIIEPDLEVTEGFPGEVMALTLQGTGFNEKVTPVQLHKLVDYLAGKTGN